RDIARVAGNRPLERTLRVAGDPFVDRLRIRRADVGTISIHPPILDPAPRPFLDVEHVVSKPGETAVDADIDADDRRDHQRDRHDADDHPQRRQPRAHLVRPDLRKRDPEGLEGLVEETHVDFRISIFDFRLGTLGEGAILQAYARGILNILFPTGSERRRAEWLSESKIEI